MSHPYLEDFPPAQRPDATATPWYAPPTAENAIGPASTGGTFLEKPSLWNTVQNLPLIGRQGADAFREDLGNIWQSVKDRAQGWRTRIPWGSVASAAATVAPIPGLGPEEHATLAGIEDVLRGGKTLPRFAILSSDIEGLSATAKAARHQAFGEMLRAEGWSPIEHKGGVWKNDAGKLVKENGYIVPGMDRPQAVHAGARVGQQSVITNEGYHNVQTGETAPFTGAGAPGKDEPYTLLPSGKKLGMRFDFEHPTRAGTPEPTALGRRVTPAPTQPFTSAEHTIPPGAPSVLGASEPKYGYQAPERIRAVAYKLPDGKVVKGNPGELHPDLFERSPEIGEYSPFNAWEDGFVTTSGRFVNRKQAYRVAQKANQYSGQSTANLPKGELDAGDLGHPGPTLGEGGVLRTELPPSAGQRHGLPLAREDVDALGVAGRHLLQDAPDKSAWLEKMKAAHPAYAPHLEGWAGDRAYAVATRGSLPVMPEPQTMLNLARSPEGASTRPWYHTWWPSVQSAFGDEDAEMLTRFHAVLSAQASPERNAQLSLRALADYKAGKLDFPSVGTVPQRIAALQRVAKGGAIAEEGPKVNNFYLALKGHPEAVVLDRHMARAYLGDEYGREQGGKHLSNEQYYALDARVRADAKEAGVSPRDYQAMVWGGQTKYPFEPPEHFLWKYLAENSEYYLKGRKEPPRFTQNANIGDEVNKWKANQMLRAGSTAPSHAAIRVGTHVFEVPMAQAHAGALKKAIEALREPGFNADDIMAAAEDGFTHGDGKFIPRDEVENLHSSDFINAKRANPRDRAKDDDQ